VAFAGFQNVCANLMLLVALTAQIDVFALLANKMAHGKRNQTSFRPI
jgi:hypothetical protein